MPGESNPTTTILKQGRFRLERQLGVGGMGEVHLATDRMLHRQVAIKTVRAELCKDPNVVKRVERECLLHAKIGSHPHIVALYDMFQEHEMIHLVLEYVSGMTLQQYLAQEASTQTRPLPLKAAFAIAGQILDALSRIHAQGVVHRDIKPANIMLNWDDRGEVTAKLMDFGIARLTDTTDVMTQVTTSNTGGPGTPLYMAPEQIDGRTYGPVTPATDLYAVGVVLYQLFSGSPPFTGTLTEVISGHVNGNVPSVSFRFPPVDPAGVQGLIDKALAKHPTERFASARDFRDALLRLSAAQPNTMPSGVGAGVLARTAPLNIPAPVSGVDTAPPLDATGTTLRPFKQARRAMTGAFVAVGVILFLGVALILFGPAKWSPFARLTGPAPSEGTIVYPLAPPPPVAAPLPALALPTQVPTSAPAVPATTDASPAATPGNTAIAEALPMAPPLDTLAVAAVVVGDGSAAPGATVGAPAGGTPAAAAGTVSTTPTYVVQRGDTLPKIAASQNVDVKDLQWWNRLKSTRSIWPGQTLYLYPRPDLPDKNAFFEGLARAAREAAAAAAAAQKEKEAPAPPARRTTDEDLYNPGH